MYIVLNTFKEKEHDGIVYRKGETYPKGKYKAKAERVAELQSNENKYRYAFLGEEVKEEVAEEKEAPKDKKTASKK